jgi:hypothetical protein
VREEGDACPCSRVGQGEVKLGDCQDVDREVGGEVDAGEEEQEARRVKGAGDAVRSCRGDRLPSANVEKII